MNALKLRKMVETKMSHKFWQQAIVLMKREPVIVERSWKLLWNLGWCAFKLRRYREAEEVLTRARDRAPKSAPCWWALAMAQLKQKRWAEAEINLKVALSIRESHPSRTGLALAYLAQGKVAEAEQTRLENIRLRPNDGKRHESYSPFLVDVGRRDEAKIIHKKALAPLLRAAAK
jgi:tetratricopeptide (TPR) repeat protein